MVQQLERLEEFIRPSFDTPYSKRLRVVCCHGSREKIKYGGHYDEYGRIVLEEVGRENVYDKIQSHAESVDIHVLMKRYQNGDVSALSSAQGFFADISEFPTNYAEALNHITAMQEQFDMLPAETKQKFGNSFSEFLASAGTADFFDKLGIVIPDTDPADPTPADPTPADNGGAE